MKLINMFRHYSREKRNPMILITGIPKSGTTAIYHSIRTSLPANSVCQFEPEHRNLHLPDVITTPVLVKSFLGASHVYDHFNKKILIIRDPRDLIISQMLYRPFNIISKGIITPDEKLDQVLAELLILLQRKEMEPGSVSVKEIRDHLRMNSINENLEKLIGYYKKKPEPFLYKYEDFVDGRLKPLNKYLGLKIIKVGDVPEKRVIRSKSYGNWKDWFTKSDVQFYREIFQNFMKTFGYDDNWELNPTPCIDPALTSEYVKRLIIDAKIHKLQKS